MERGAAVAVADAESDGSDQGTDGEPDDSKVPTCFLLSESQSSSLMSCPSQQTSVPKEVRAPKIMVGAQEPHRSHLERSRKMPRQGSQSLRASNTPNKSKITAAQRLEQPEFKEQGLEVYSEFE